MSEPQWSTTTGQSINTGQPEDANLAERSGRSVASRDSSAPADSVTGLPDRWQFESWLSDQIDKNRRAGDRCAVLMFSVSNLASINLNYGSQVGDDVLRIVATALATSVGSSGQVARHVGSELVVLWPSVRTEADTFAVAQDLMTLLPEQATFHSFVVPLEWRVAGLFCGSDMQAITVLEELQANLVEAQQDRDCKYPGGIVVRTSAAGPHRPEVLAVQLQQAFDNDEFTMVYQPIVSFSRGTIVGFESFLRWSAPGVVGGPELISPAVFIDALRESPVVVPLHAWILRESAEQVGEWDSLLGEGSLFCSVNLDPSFVLDPRFAHTITETVADVSLRPNQLLLDIKSANVGSNLTRMWPALQQAKVSGVGIALEDFGIGYGSAHLLRECQFDVIRLPREMVAGLGLVEEDQIIVQSLVDLAHNMKCAVIAEGVETQYQAELLAEAGCDFVQGYYLGRPDSAKHISQDLTRHYETAQQVGALAARVRANGV